MPIGTTGSAAQSFGYAGAYTDPESGFLYLRARYYDPASQQFLTVDPLLALTEQAYNYVAGSPTNASDPSGAFCPWCLAVGIGIGVGAVTNVVALGIASHGTATREQYWNAGIAGGIAGGVSALAGPFGELVGISATAAIEGMIGSLILRKGVELATTATINWAGAWFGQATANAVLGDYSTSPVLAANYAALGSVPGVFCSSLSGGTWEELTTVRFGFHSDTDLPFSTWQFPNPSKKSTLIAGFGVSTALGAGSNWDDQIQRSLGLRK